jgi:hypothetical protein
MLHSDPVSSFERIAAHLLEAALDASSVVDGRVNGGDKNMFSMTATLEGVALLAEGQLAINLGMPRTWRCNQT